jgi:hypothetical protein
VTIGQILDPKYLIADSSIVKSVINVVDGKSMDENITRLLESISIFCLFVETISNEKERKKRIIELMSSFGNKTFFESNKKVQHVGIQELIPRFTNNTTIFKNNSLPFHLCIFFFFIPLNSLLECKKLVDPLESLFLAKERSEQGRGIKAFTTRER